MEQLPFLGKYYMGFIDIQRQLIHFKPVEHFA